MIEFHYHEKVDNVCRFVLAQSCVHWPSLSLLPSHDEHWCLGRASWRWTFYGFSNESHHSGKAGHEGVGLQRWMKQWESEELISAAAGDRDVANLLPPVQWSLVSPRGGRSATPVHRGHNSSDDSLSPLDGSIPGTQSK